MTHLVLIPRNTAMTLHLKRDNLEQVNKPLCCSHYIKYYFSSFYTDYPILLISFSEVVFSWSVAFTAHKTINFFKNFWFWSINLYLLILPV